MMSLQAIRRNLTLCAIVFGLAVLLSASAAHRPPQAPAAADAAEIVLNVDPAQSSVQYTVGSSLHTVHGTFALKRGTLRIDPATGKANGEIVVDAISGQSGNDSRDKKMHKEVLESARFTDIIFRPDRVEGSLQPQGTSSAKLHGVCVLHGSEHELTTPVRAELTSGQWKGTATFSVPYNDWGLKNPGNFLLKVDHTVNIEVQMAGSIQGQAASAKQ
jgi:polyisoprenoid-binding protein YceI